MILRFFRGRPRNAPQDNKAEPHPVGHLRPQSIVRTSQALRHNQTERLRPLVSSAFVVAGLQKQNLFLHSFQLKRRGAGRYASRPPPRDRRGVSCAAARAAWSPDARGKIGAAAGRRRATACWSRLRHRRSANRGDDFPQTYVTIAPDRGTPPAAARAAAPAASVRRRGLLAPASQRPRPSLS